MKCFKNLDWKKVTITLVSVILMGVFLSVLKLLDYGTDPFSFMNFNISATIGWSLGNWQIVLNVLMFIPVILWGREQIGIGTVLNMVLIGYTVDLCMQLWSHIGFPALLEQDVLRIIVMLFALAGFVFSAATYMSSGLGTAPFDALPIMISHKLSKVPFKLIRFLWDLTAVLIGIAFGGKVGIVTALMVLFLGQTVELVAKLLFKRKV